MSATTRGDRQTDKGEHACCSVKDTLEDSCRYVGDAGIAWPGLDRGQPGWPDRTGVLALSIPRQYAGKARAGCLMVGYCY